VSVELTQARVRLAELVARVEQTGERVTVTRRGQPAVVLVAPDELATLEETLAVLSTPDILAELRHAQAQAAAGEVTELAAAGPDPGAGRPGTTSPGRRHRSRRA